MQLQLLFFLQHRTAVLGGRRSATQETRSCTHFIENTLWVNHSFGGFSTNNTGIWTALTKLPKACDRNTAALFKSICRQRKQLEQGSKPQRSILQQGLPRRYHALLTPGRRQRHSDTWQLPQPRQTLLWNATVSPLDYHSQNSIYTQQLEAFMASMQYPRSSPAGTCRRKQHVCTTARKILLTHCTNTRLTTVPLHAKKNWRGNLWQLLKETLGTVRKHWTEYTLNKTEKCTVHLGMFYLPGWQSQQMQRRWSKVSETFYAAVSCHTVSLCA